MRCIVCGNKEVYNRAVIELESDAHIGEFCMDCELTIFGEVFTEFTTEGGGCDICGGNGKFEFPKYIPTSQGPRGDQEMVPYELPEESDAPTLCSAHYQGVRSTEP